MSVYKSTVKEWQWIINVNLYGVIHGLQVFVPLMLQQPKEEIMHIINTSSIAGVHSGSFHVSPYTASKHAVVALSESLSCELSETSIKVHVLLPGPVNTNIINSYRNCPQDLQNEITEEQRIKIDKFFIEIQALFSHIAIHPDAVAEKVFDAIAQNHFYIFTHQESGEVGVRERFKDITENRKPGQSNSKL